jgi:hypothetical protein
VKVIKNRWKRWRVVRSTGVGVGSSLRLDPTASSPLVELRQVAFASSCVALKGTRDPPWRRRVAGWACSSEWVPRGH